VSLANLSIRPLEADDAAVYHALRLRMLREHADAFTSSFEEDATKPLAWVVARLTPDAEEGVVLGAFDATRALVGSIGFAREERRKQRHKALVFGMFVAPEHAQRGIGRALLAACIARARATPGLERLTLTVTATNERAIRLYEAAGFRVFGLEERALKIGDRYFPKAHMVLDLHPTGTAARP
jgi:RimJ/RimL family protein N-acetyltransferase